MKKRVRLLESQMNRTGEEDTTTDPNTDTSGDVFLDVVVALRKSRNSSSSRRRRLERRGEVGRRLSWLPTTR